MIKHFCNYLLSVDGAADEFNEEEMEKMEMDVSRTHTAHFIEIIISLRNSKQRLHSSLYHKACCVLLTREPFGK